MPETLTIVITDIPEEISNLMWDASLAYAPTALSVVKTDKLEFNYKEVEAYKNGAAIEELVRLTTGAVLLRHFQEYSKIKSK